ncbi:hypothetical protein Btru_031863 [Bulinus truncatus]|nr:hypothetical protein Btru_031863 [Bulinus truncatus]
MESACTRCPLINTARLKPIRQRVNRIIMTILDSGHVSLEILGHLNNQPDGPEIAKELFHVSPDGKHVEVYQSLEGVAAIDGNPVSSQPEKVFKYPDMPEKQWKMYQHAFKFVDVIKSKTAKVVLMTDRARCMLMENLPFQNFQASFNDGVTILLTESKVTISEADGSSISFDITLTSSHVKAKLIEKMEYMKKCHLQCLDIQDSVGRLQSKESKQELFPLSIGTKTAPFKLTSQPSDAQRFLYQSVENLYYKPPDTQNSDIQQKNVQLPQVACSSPALHQNQFSHRRFQCMVRPQGQPVDVPASLNERLSVQQCQNCDHISLSKSGNQDFEPIRPLYTEMISCPVQCPAASMMTKNPCHFKCMPPDNIHVLQMEGKGKNVDIFEHCLNCNENQSNSDDLVLVQCNNTDVLMHPPCTLNCARDLPQHVLDTTPPNAASYYQSINYFTPKKPACPPFHPNCYSADSTRHRQCHKVTAKHNLTLGALVDEKKLNSVKRSLFTEGSSVEPFTSPLPTPACFRHDLPDVPLTPSLELSFCTETPETYAVTNNMAESLNAYQQEIELCRRLQQSEISDPLQSNNQQVSNIPLEDQKYQPPIHNPKYLNETMSLSSSSSLLSGAHSSKDPKVLVTAPNFTRRASLGISLPLSFGVPSPTEANPCQTSAKQMLISDQIIKPENKPVGSMAGNICSEQNSINSYASSSSNSSRNTSWCHNRGGGIKLDEKHNKSDSGCFSMTNKGPLLPLSPQKQFLMSEVERCRVDLTRPPHLHNSLDMSVSSYYSDSPSSSPSSGCDPIRQVFVPYTGWASFFATGAVWILYNDGTQLGIKSMEATMTYIDQDGSQKRYKNSDVIPEIIKLKLEKLPMVIDLLMKSPPINANLY